MREHQTIVHPLQPLFQADSKILILGSFPSIKTREYGFFYGHPQNRFWKVLAALLNVSVPETIEEKRTMLLEHHIAVWDVIASCTITGSSDSSIKDVVPNDLGKILKEASVEKIYANGATAWKLYNKYTKKMTGMDAVKLPSTSPANAAFRLERLIEEWKVILDTDS